MKRSEMSEETPSVKILLQNYNIGEERSLRQKTHSISVH